MNVKYLTSLFVDRGGDDALKFDAILRNSANADGKKQPKPDRTATDNEKWPPIDETRVEAPRDGKIRYELDGQGVLVERAVTPSCISFWSACTSSASRRGKRRRSSLLWMQATRSPIATPRSCPGASTAASSGKAIWKTPRW
ncbi:hypothetical protein STUTZSP0542_38150 [Stutzerimonas marianensis]